MPLPPRIIFLNRFYWPDETATAQLLADLCRSDGRPGAALVTVLTSRPRQSETPRSEARRGVRIERVGGTRSRRFGLLAKALDFATYSCGALFRLMRVARRGDLVITLTDPPLLGIGASLVAWVRGCRSLHWIQDIYPEIAIVVTGRKALAVSRPLRDAAWHRADACVTLSREMADVLAESGVAAEKIHVIPNWPPAGLGPPPAAAIAAKREAWGVAGRFVIAYSGNLGRVHEVTPILDTAEAMQADDQTVFLFVGDGSPAPFFSKRKRSGANWTMSNFYPPNPAGSWPPRSPPETSIGSRSGPVASGSSSPANFPAWPGWDARCSFSVPRIARPPASWPTTDSARPSPPRTSPEWSPGCEACAPTPKSARASARLR